MATAKGDANVIGTRGAAVDPPAPAPATVPEGQQAVTLIGVGGTEEAKINVPTPLPIDLIYGGAMYNLSDRVAGVYTFRHP